jgi:hypothetical protein
MQSIDPLLREFSSSLSLSIGSPLSAQNRLLHFTSGVSSLPPLPPPPLIGTSSFEKGGSKSHPSSRSNRSCSPFTLIDIPQSGEIGSQTMEIRENSLSPIFSNVESNYLNGLFKSVIIYFLLFFFSKLF